MPTASTGTAIIAADTVRPPAAAASAKRDSLASSGGKSVYGSILTLVASLRLWSVTPSRPEIGSPGVLPIFDKSDDMRPNIVPMPLKVSPTVFFGSVIRRPVYLNGLKPGIDQRFAVGLGVGDLFQLVQRGQFVEPHAKHLVAVHGEFAVGRRQRVDAQQPVARHRIFDRVVVAGRPEARNFFDHKCRRSLERLGERLEW